MRICSLQLRNSGEARSCNRTLAGFLSLHASGDQNPQGEPVEKNPEFTRGRRLFLTDKVDIGAEELATEIRRRWNLENKNHHPRDGMALLEDTCRCRTGNLRRS